MDSNTSIPKQLENATGGLFLMAIFTAVWILIAETALQGRDYWALGVVFGIIIVYFVINYNRLNKISQSLSKEPMVETQTEKAKTKRFYCIFAIEGIAIFVMKNVLLNIGHDNLFFPFFALIVGLHFFPLAKLFNRGFYYAIGGWICLVAIAGFILTYQPVPVYMPAAIIGIGCALATAINGIRMIRQGNLLIKQT
ncbi:MAG: hypothetical protein V4592_20080 [Bacteroidota bacterium]